MLPVNRDLTNNIYFDHVSDVFSDLIEIWHSIVFVFRGRKVVNNNS